MLMLVLNEVFDQLAKISCIFEGLTLMENNDLWISSSKLIVCIKYYHLKYPVTNS